MATNVNDVTPEAADRHKGSGSLQLPGGWTKHAPAGGIMLNGKHFKGGQFIPNEDIENASPEEMAALQAALEAKEKYGPEGAKKAAAQFQFEKAAKQSEALANEPSLNVREHLFIIDNGSLLGSEEYYGSLIIRNNLFKNIVISPYELKIYSVLHAKRVDIVDPFINKVTSINNTEGVWPVIPNTDDSTNVYEQLTNDAKLEIQDIQLAEYTLLNNLSQPVQSILKPQAPQSPQSPTAIGNTQPSTATVGNNQGNKQQNTQPPQAAVGMSLKENEASLMKTIPQVQPQKQLQKTRQLGLASLSLNKKKAAPPLPDSLSEPLIGRLVKVLRGASSGARSKA